MTNKKISNLARQKIIVAVAAAVSFALIVGVNGLESSRDDSNGLANETANVASNEDQTENDDILSEIPGIACWVDSLTYGSGGFGVSYPWVLSNLLQEQGLDIPVFNLGVSGETSLTISARAGGIDNLLTDAIVIPATTEPVKVSFTADGKTIAPLMRTYAGIEYVYIDGIKGQLTVDKTDNNQYYFTRCYSGDAVTIAAGTKIETIGSFSYVDDIPIIYIGQNGGWDNDPEVLIAQQQAIIDTFEKNKDKFIILGLATRYYAYDEELEQAMEEHWGDHYINLRAELSSYDNISTTEVTITDSDWNKIDAGLVPDCLLSDVTHYNAIGYEMIGKLVLQRLSDLGYLNYWSLHVYNSYNKTDLI